MGETTVIMNRATMNMETKTKANIARGTTDPWVDTITGGTL